MKTRFFILENGDIINVEQILYIHLSKSEECAYVYIKHLMHASDNYIVDYGNLSKRIKISLADYDKFIQLY